MKAGKKILAAMLVFAVALSCLLPAAEVKAAAKPKSDTYVTKNGITYETKVRGRVQSRYESMYITSKLSGCYISKVKTSSPNLVAKATYSYNYDYKSEYSSDTSANSNFRIGYFARKPGTYTITFTVNNKKKQKVGTFKTKVYVDKYDSPYKTFSYAGIKNFGAYDILTKKASGKLNVKCNPGYTLKSVEVGKYDAKGNKVYKKIKNNSKITLEKTTVYDDKEYSYWGAEYDYMCPATLVRITYKDKKLGTTVADEMIIFKMK